MKLPKTLNRYCKYCKKKTSQKIVQLKTGTKRGSLKWGSIQRAKGRGSGSGFGNKGRWGSKPAKPKRGGAKTSKKLYLKFVCQTCKKATMTSKGKRTKRVELE